MPGLLLGAPRSSPTAWAEQTPFLNSSVNSYAVQNSPGFGHVQFFLFSQSVLFYQYQTYVNQSVSTVTDLCLAAKCKTYQREAKTKKGGFVKAAKPHMLKKASDLEVIQCCGAFKLQYLLWVPSSSCWVPQGGCVCVPRHGGTA